MRTNIPIPAIFLGRLALYFLPDRLLVREGNVFGAVLYRDMSIHLGSQQFIEDEAVPRDAEVVDHTWAFVNKDGGPDRRFSNNRRLPICLYEEISLDSPNGLNELLQVSRIGVGTELDATTRRLSELLARAQAAEIVKREDARHEQQESSNKKLGRRPTDADRLFVVLLELLCCMMVADGRASASEKKQIRDLLNYHGSPWTEPEISERISEFIDRIRTDGYRKTVAAALTEIDLFKEQGKQAILLQCLQAVANADEKVTDGEQRLLLRIKGLVG